MEHLPTRRKLRFGAKAIAAYLDVDNVPKVRRLIRQNLIPGVYKMGRQDVLDEEMHVELMRARARGVA